MPTIIAKNKVLFERDEIADFNDRWPCSLLDPRRHYWFEFDDIGCLVDTDVPEHQDGDAAKALSDDAYDFLLTMNVKGA